MGLRRRKPRPEIVVIERSGDSSAKWLFWGAMLGAGLALLYAPRNGEETRRSVQRTLWRVRAATEEKLDELMQQYGPGRGTPSLADDIDEEEYARLADSEGAGELLDDDASLGEEQEEPELSAREELERRLAEARARRRRRDLEEPTA